LTAMKAAFSANYKTVFRPAASGATLESEQRDVTYTEPNPEWKQKLDEIRRNAEKSGGGRTDEKSKKDSGEKRKKSRWE